MKIITKLGPDEIFVFGSNLAGIHGAGAAKTAHQLFGAKWGIGQGITGRCYAIPTKDAQIMARFLHEINYSVGRFLEVARAMPEKKFIITPIGCGLAGFTPKQIAPMFDNAPENCILPDEFKNLAQSGESFHPTPKGHPR